LLGTIPVLCMGLFAPPAAVLSQRLGSRHALAAALALIGVFGIARALVPGAALLILLTIPAGIGMGLGNALLPVSVKERFSDRPVFATGVYAAGLNGTQIVAGLSVAWLADRMWSRRTWMALCSGVGVLSLLGVVLIPGAGFLWAFMLGATIGPLFSLTMALPLDVGLGPAEVAA